MNADNTLVVLDIETTGLREERDKILELAMPEPLLTCRAVIRAVARHSGVAEAKICGRSRTATVAATRGFAMGACRELVPGASYHAIADAFGRDHSTVVSACKRFLAHREEYHDSLGEIRRLAQEEVRPVSAMDAVRAAGKLVDTAARQLEEAVERLTAAHNRLIAELAR